MISNEQVKAVCSGVIKKITEELGPTPVLVIVAVRDGSDTGFNVQVLNNCEELLPMFAQSVVDCIQDANTKGEVAKNELH